MSVGVNILDLNIMSPNHNPFPQDPEPYEESLAAQFLNLGLGGVAKAELICGESRIDRIRRRRRKRKAKRKENDKSEFPSPQIQPSVEKKKKKCRKCRKCKVKKEMRRRRIDGSRSASPATSTASSVDSSESSSSTAAAASAAEYSMLPPSPVLKVRLLDIATDARFIGALYR